MWDVSGVRRLAPLGAALLAAPHDQQTRWSVLCELTPVQFVQLRGGVRYSGGIPQLDSQHTRLFFVELHGFL